MGLKPRLAAFDMDGTLLNKESQMTETTKKACLELQQQGCKLVLSTGRTFGSAQIPIDAFPFDGFVCSNGATVFESDGKMVHQTLLPNDLVADAILTLRQEVLYYELHDTASNRWMIQEDRERLEAMLEEDTSLEGISIRKFAFYKLARVIPLQEMLEMLSKAETKIVKLFIWHSNPELLEWVREKLVPWNSQVNITSSGRHNVEMLPQGVSKWEGLLYFCNKWRIRPEEVMVFGDAENDREALSAAGYAVAMENASPEIKELAKYIAPHHDDDGVAQFIRQQITECE
ncbi:HAD family hydrolase [Brevibacillus sp. AY1]|uniref:HAD family hydrolase n=1 Tax=Brevibacillus sp. AY1 TaxID=2807621 RepID=UPI002457069D|nr:HAD family hydrolase [Brevibacillus sp. AY1]MDH4619095.1 HAD family hydrolase [Brevibacillus sp. AY1]